MAKRFGEAVEVTARASVHGEPVPRAFRWRGVRYEVVTVLGHWREDAGWWAGGGVAVPQRDLWRLEARRGPSTGVYELVREQGRWRLARLWD